MRQILISSAKSLFPTLFGYILHPILVSEAVQARPLISNTGNALQQILQNAFRGTHFVEQSKIQLGMHITNYNYALLFVRVKMGLLDLCLAITMYCCGS